LFRARDGAKLATFAIPDATQTYAAAWAPDGQHVFLGETATIAKIYNRDGSIDRELIGHHSRVNSAEYSDDGNQLLTAEARTSRIFDVHTGNIVQTFEQSHGALSAHWLGADQIITAGYDGFVRIFERATGKLVTDFGDPMTQFLDLAVRPHHPRVLAVAGHDGVVSLWDLYTHVRIAALSGHTRPVTTVSWSPDGALLASSADDGLVKIWDPDEMRELETINLGTSAALDVQWNRAGDQLVTANAAAAPGGDLWDASRDHHTLAELRAFLAEHVPYQLDNGVLFTSDLR
jgi:WD40 repeat protein